MATNQFLFPGNIYPIDYNPSLPTFDFNPSLGQLLVFQDRTVVSGDAAEQILQLKNGLTLKLAGSGFEYDALGNGTAGTLTDIEILLSDGTTSVQTLTGLNLDFHDFYTRAVAFGPSLLAQWLFSGDDTINGSSGADELIGSGGNDTLEGFAGNDFFDGGAGTDSYSGGFDIDTLSFESAYTDLTVIGGVTVNANTTTQTVVDPYGNTETFTTMEAFRGTQFDDVMTGATAGPNVANESFMGLGGRDILDGGAGTDEVRYDRDSIRGGTLGVVVNLVTGVATDGFGYEDTLSNIENVRGTLYNDTVIGNSAGNDLRGFGGVDSLSGGGGNDTLDGGSSADSLIGGSGDDTYLVDNTGDQVDEISDGGSGIDTIRSTVTFSLAAGALVQGEVEHLTLLGSANINGTGNALNNTLTGNGATNYLYGEGGADTMIGLGGNDFYVVQQAGDVVTEASGGGTDTVRSYISYTLGANVEHLTFWGSANANGTGNSLNNTLTGNNATNYLYGEGGTDTMIGLGGNDFYLVQQAGDVVTEASGGGTDTVRSYISYTLGANVEHLTFWGSAAVSGTGNSLNNTLTGNGATNYLNGQGGADTMIGLGGNDFYVVENAGDVVTEASGGGTDTVRSYISYTLGANVEHLTFWGSAAVNGTGNSLNNTILGNGAANILNGSTGNDTMTGGAGNDHFVFNTALNASTNVDSITDFNVVNDTIRLENAIFTALGAATGTLTSAMFWASTSGTAHDADDRIIYETDTGKLVYDSNGNAAGGSVHFATLSAGLALTNADFLII